MGVNRFILVSSILVNGAAMGQILNPAYIVLNVFGLTLIAKLQAEQYIRRSGINYTIIRPGGLRDEPSSGNIVMEPEVVYTLGLRNISCILGEFLIWTWFAGYTLRRFYLQRASCPSCCRSTVLSWCLLQSGGDCRKSWSPKAIFRRSVQSNWTEMMNTCKVMCKWGTRKLYI